MKIAVIHYNPIEYYPPVHNFINYFDSKRNIFIHSTSPGNHLSLNKYSKAKVYRFSKFKNSNKLGRYINLIVFNASSFLHLIEKRPTVILYYETWSCFPVYLYFFFRPRTKILVHYHEFTSKEDIRNSPSPVLKFLHKIEQKLLKKVSWISHTNESRLNLFLKENKVSDYSIKEIMPNYPPKKWTLTSQLEFKSIIKMVYVGSLSMQHMYFQEIVDWIIEKKGQFTLDIYSINIYQDALDYVQEKGSKLVEFKGGVCYDKLPEILEKYNIGLVLYNGASLNYIYNAPNKLFEYYACGLDVWFSKDLITSQLYKRENCIPKILEIDFEKLNDLNLNQVLNRDKMEYISSEFNAENVLLKIDKYIEQLEITNS